MKVDYKRIHSVLIWIAYCVTVIYGITYYVGHKTSSLLFMLMAFWIANLLYFAFNFRYYLIHFFFFLAMFLFLFSRPLIDYIQTGSFTTYNKNTYEFSFIVLIISMAGLLIGGIIGKNFHFKHKYSENKPRLKINENYETHVKHLRWTALCFFMASYPFYVLRLVERYLYRRTTSYYEYYASFNSELPYIVYIISIFMFFSMCVYLATKPPKKQTIIVLIMYVLANSIYLLIGTRNPFLLSLIFSFVYYCMRQFGDKKEIWIGKFEKILVIAAIPILMIFLGAMNYIRDDAAITQDSLIGLITDFVYKQGTSFGVLAKGYLYECYLPVRDFRNYTFGDIIDYVHYGSIGNILFGTQPLPETNSFELALNSNSYAHNISYITMGDEYLNGHGIGSSYIIELFTDYGYIGVMVFSIILGFILVYMMKAAYQRKVLPFTLSLVVLENIFFTPRASYTSSFFPLFTMQFWFVIILIFVGTKMLEKATYVVMERRIKMFDNYSLCDLWANIYKNRKRNLILGIVVFFIVLMPFVIKASKNSEEVESEGINYSTYMAYSVDSGKVVTKDDTTIEPYSDFFVELINGNLNGAYLFSDVTEKELQKISEELSIDVVQLRNSDSNYWYGKIVVSSIPESGTVSIKILTPSKSFNEIVAEKIDTLVNESKEELSGVSANKISAVSTSEVDTVAEDIVDNGIDMSTVVKGIIIGFVVAVFLICGINFVFYIFNPSMNDGVAFKNYGLDFVYDFDTASNCVEMLSYKEKECGDFVLVATNKKVLNKFKNFLKKEDINVSANLISIDNIHGLIESQAIVFVEEYGSTRFKTFEKAIQQVKNVDKSIIGVINLPL